MTDEPAQDAARDGTPAEPRERARIEPTTGHRTADLLPFLYLLGFVVLAGAIYFLWANPPATHLEPQEASRVETLQQQVATLRDEVATLRNRPAAPAAPGMAEFSKLQQQVAELAARPAPPPLQPIENRLAALEGRSTATPEQVAQLSAQVIALAKSTPDLAPLGKQLDGFDKRLGDEQARLQSLSAKADEQQGKLASLQNDVTGKLAQAQNEVASKVAQVQSSLSDRIASVQKDLSGRLDAVAAQSQKTEQSITQLTQKVQLATRLQGVATALSAGHRLGDIPGAPPALARYAQTDPPTEAALRGSFDGYAAKVQAAEQPQPGGKESFGERIWARAQQSVTVRQGDHVLVGDQSAGILARARDLLDNGDLAGAVKALGGLSGAAAEAMQPWMEQARNLLDARAALASLAAG